MERVEKILTLFAATLLLLPFMEAQHYPPPRPLCASQFALATYACSLLPYSPLLPPLPPVPTPPDDDDDDGDDDNDDDGDDGGGDDGGDEPQERHNHNHHGHGHRRKQRSRRHRHRHGHGHHHRSAPLTPQEDGCCKWLSQLDNQCVCDLLLRLPSFLLKPAHTYSVYVGASCNVTYTCAHP